ncbi:MAG TPA: hypothetical protein PLH29_03880, partial [bacterium]|nr:hypothetical protein [bacterium]
VQVSKNGLLGGTGGGVIKIIVGATSTIYGVINANGGTGGVSYSNDGGSGGGGSGGSIWIDTDAIAGNGIISANGGAGGRANGGGAGGGGAGGRIAIYATSTSNFDFNSSITVTGGSPGSNYGTAYSGGSGSKIFVKKNGGSSFNDLYVYNAGSPVIFSSDTTYRNIFAYNSAGIICNSALTLSGTYGGDGTGSSTILGLATFGSGAIIASGTMNVLGTTTFGTNFTVGGYGGTTYFNLGASSTNATSLTINSGGYFEYQNLSSTSPASLSGLTINSGGTLRHKANTSVYTNALNLNIFGNATINNGGSINISGKGYAGNVTATGSAPALTGGGGSYYGIAGGGGAYGGAGGQGRNNTTISTSSNPYGSSTAPTDLGASGGAGGSIYAGGAGGGAVKLNVTGTLRVAYGASINANGSNGVGSGNYDPGGGAGGSVWLIANAITGSGAITANGGNGYFNGATYYGGGGGGGRIAISVAQDEFEGIISSAAGIGYTAGAEGSEVGLASKLYRSVGATQTNLNTNNATVTIADNTATFSSALSSLIGVGDAIEYYKTSSLRKLAFITARVSSTTYSVANWDGDLPIATTTATALVYRPFATLSNWAQATTTTANSNFDAAVKALAVPGQDLVASNTSLLVSCYNDALDTATVTITGWTTDSSHYIKIYTPHTASQVGTTQRHTGKWDTAGYRLEVTNSNGLDIRDNNVRVEGLQIKLNMSDNIGYGGISFLTLSEPDSTDQRAAWNIITASNSGSGNAYGIIAASPDNTTTRFFSNIIYDLDYGLYVANANSYIYNNTTYNCDTGIYGTSTTKVVENLAQACGTDTCFVSSVADTWGENSDRNLSSDNTAPGTNAQKSATINFKDSTNHDFHLAATDTIAKNAWDTVDTMADYYYLDIDGNTKSLWDIGADEMSQAVYRSVGPANTAILAQASGGTDHLNIDSSASQATFDSNLATNIGVGDAIIYGSDSYITFITARTNATTFTVKNYYGDNPTAISNDATWKIYRAFTSLSGANACQGNTSIPSSLRSFDDCTIIKDIITYNQIRHYALYNDNATDTTAVDFSGWTTGPENQITLFTPRTTSEVGESQRHTGRPNTGYILAPASGSYAFNIGTDYLTIDGLSIDSTNVTKAISTDYNVQKQLIIRNNIIHANSGASTYGIYDSGTTGNRYDYNNIIYNVNTGIYHNVSSAANSIYLYNNTLVNNTTGINVSAGTAIKYSANNLFSGVTTATSSGLTTYTNNISSSNVTFANASTHDYHLALTDTVAIDTGTSTPRSNTSYPLTTDIDGQGRGQYDVGADEASQYFTATISETGGDFSTLALWEEAAKANLTATSTAVFTVNTITGQFPIGATMVGATSGARGTIAFLATSSSQLMLTSLASSSFQQNEQVNLEGAEANHVILSDAGNPVIVRAQIGGAWTTPDNTEVNIDTGWSTNEWSYIRIYTATTTRHAGSWDSAKYILAATSTSPAASLTNTQNYTEIEGLQIEQNGTGYGLYSYNAAANITGTKISKNLIKRTNTEAGGTGLKLASQTLAKLWNNVVFGNFTRDYDLGGATNNTIYLYNNTAYGGTACYYSDDGDTIAINNLAQGCTTSFNQANFSANSKNNLSADWTAPGTNSVTTSTVNFYNTATGDFHMRSGSPAKNTGYYLATDSHLAVTDDFEGEARYQYFWDIGADQAPIEATLYRSVGNDSSNLNTGSALVTISTSTATFAEAMPNNIGVGDALQYGDPLKLAFITSRISSTTYGVQTWNGYYPETADATTTAIYRAHLKLADWQSRTSNTAIDASLVGSVSGYGSDLDASSTILKIACYGATSPDDAAVAISGWTTSTSSSITIFTPRATTEVGTSQRHAGVWDDSKYRLVLSNDSIPLTISNGQVRVEGLQIALNDGSSNSRSAVYFNNSADTAPSYFTHAIIKNNDLDNTDLAAIYINDANAQTYIYNNLVYSFRGTSQFGIRANNGLAYVDNNTISSSTVGVYQTGGTLTLRNNAIFNNTTDLSSTGGSLTADHNASDDSIGADSHWINISSDITNETKGWNIAFTDYINYDFTVRNMFSPLYDSGVTLSTITSDIISTRRPTYDAYDVGAYEFTNPRPAYRGEGKLQVEGRVKIE